MARGATIPHPAELGDELEVPAGAGVELAPRWADPELRYCSEVLPLAVAGGRLSAGAGEVVSTDLCESLEVTNLGSAYLIVALGPANNRPEGLIGPGLAIVPPGSCAVLTMPGRRHAFYGRAGELVAVTRYRDRQPPSVTRYAAGGWWSVVSSPAASGVLYSTPWGLPVEYGGFSVRETSEAARAVFRLREGNAAGRVLESVSLSAGESSSDHDVATLTASSALYLELVSGAVELVARVR